MQISVRLWCFLACLLMLGTREGWSAPRYLVYDLGDAVPRNLNDAGLAAGNAGVPQLAVRLQQGQAPFPIGTLTPPPFGGSLAQAIGPQGAIVGYANGEGFGGHAFLWTEAQGIQDLGTLDGMLARFSAATSLNGAGTIVGYGDNAGLQARPLVWLAGMPMELGTPSLQGHADAINEHGDIVGDAQTLTGATHAMLWPIEGGIVDLHTITGGSFSFALSVNADRQVAGNVDNFAFRWSPATGMQLLPLLPGDLGSSATSINAAGLIVGQGIPPSPCAFCGPPPHAVLWDGTGPVDLNAQLNTPGWTLYAATGINTQGWIVGIGVHDGNSRAFLLVPDWTIPTAPVTLVSVVQGDFNGDGQVDSAGVAEDYTIWRCLAGDAACTQLPGRAGTLVAGDLNGDGQDDLAALSGWQIYAMTDGQTWQLLPGALWSLIIGDFAQDGHQHLAGVGGGWDLWYSPDMGRWQQLPGKAYTLATEPQHPGQPDAMIAYNGLWWRARTLGAWEQAQ